MTATEQIIKDGIDGGLQEGKLWPLVSVDDDEVIFLNGANRHQSYHPSYFLLRPDFWKAVGVTRGWKEINYGFTLKNHDGNIMSSDASAGECEFKQHQFITHLQSGKTIDEALEAIK